MNQPMHHKKRKRKLKGGKIPSMFPMFPTLVSDRVSKQLHQSIQKPLFI
jgi:hypothetical protein